MRFASEIASTSGIVTAAHLSPLKVPRTTGGGRAEDEPLLPLLLGPPVLRLGVVDGVFDGVCDGGGVDDPEEAPLLGDCGEALVGSLSVVTHARSEDGLVAVAATAATLKQATAPAGSLSMFVPGR